MAIPKLQVQITADTKQAEDGLKKVSGEIGGVDNASRKAMSAVKAFAAGLVGISAIGAIFSKSVNEAQKFETTMFRIQAIIKATGGTAGRTAQDLRSFAQNLALNTLESTEGILEAQQRLLTFRKVSGDVFDRTIAVAADLSAVLGQNMSGAAIQLGRALEDPVTGLSALARTGTVFTEQQKEMVKRMVASGQMLDAQKFILSELEAQYGGAAVAAAQGYAGALDTLGQRMQEFFLSVDENLGLTKALSAVYLVAADAIKFLTDNMGRLVTYIGTALASSVAYAAFMARGWVAAFIAARAATFSLAAMLGVLRAAMIRTGILALVVGAGELVYQFTRLVSAAGNFSIAMGLLKDVATEAWDVIKRGASLVGEMIGGVAMMVQGAFLGAFAKIISAFSSLTQAIADGMNALFGTNIQGIGSSLAADLQSQSDYMTSGGAEIANSAGRSLSALLDEGLPSLQKIKDLLASIKDEKITLPDLLGVGTDDGGGAGSGGKKKTPLEEQTEAQIASLQALRDQGRETWSALGGFLQQFAGKSKAAAVAAIAIQKGLSIAQIIANTAAAQMRALAELGPIAGPPVAAKMGMYGKLQAGLVAATGLSQAMGGGGGGGSGGGGGGGGSGGGNVFASSGAAAAPAARQVDINIAGGGEFIPRSAVLRLMEEINNASDENGVMIRVV